MIVPEGDVVHAASLGWCVEWSTNVGVDELQWCGGLWHLLLTDGHVSGLALNAGLTLVD